MIPIRTLSLCHVMFVCIFLQTYIAYNKMVRLNNNKKLENWLSIFLNLKIFLNGLNNFFLN